MSGAFNLVHGSAIAVFGVLDTVATEAGPGYDNVFREPQLERANAADKTGLVGREETEIKVRVQMDTRLSSGLAQLLTGQQRERILELTADWRELQVAGLIDANGDCKIGTGSRLKQIEDRAAQPITVYSDPPGMYVDSWEKEPVVGVPRSVTWRLTPRKKGES